MVDGGVSTSVMATSPRMTATRQNLILVGGIFHDFRASAEALARYWRRWAVNRASKPISMPASPASLTTRSTC